MQAAKWEVLARAPTGVVVLVLVFVKSATGFFSGGFATGFASTVVLAETPTGTRGGGGGGTRILGGGGGGITAAAMKDALFCGFGNKAFCCKAPTAEYELLYFLGS